MENSFSRLSETFSGDRSVILPLLKAPPLAEIRGPVGFGLGLDVFKTWVMFGLFAGYFCCAPAAIVKSSGEA